MVVIDWLQTCEFVRGTPDARLLFFLTKRAFIVANSEKVILYGLCGCFLGVSVILLSIIFLSYVERCFQFGDDADDGEPASVEPEYVDEPPRLPVYRYNAKTHDGLQDI